jgi:hypothetical protein
MSEWKEDCQEKTCLSRTIESGWWIKTSNDWQCFSASHSPRYAYFAICALAIVINLGLLFCDSHMCIFCPRMRVWNFLCRKLEVRRLQDLLHVDRILRTFCTKMIDYSPRRHSPFSPISMANSIKRTMSFDKIKKNRKNHTILLIFDW